MDFDFNWAPQKLPLQMINGRSRAAAENMAGYVPNEGNPEILGNEILAENAIDNMKGYNPNLQEQRYIGRTPQQFNNAGQGQGYTFNDPEFTQYMHEQQQAEQEAARIEQQAAQREQRISDIQSQIAELEKRIADNTSKLQKWTGPADQIAAIEARKINSQDPTMIWRWKVGQDEARRIAKDEKDKNKKLAKENALYEIQNELASIIVDDKMDSSTRNAHLSKLAGLKTLAQKNGIDPIDIDKMIKEVKGDGGEQTTREKAQTDWKGLKGKPGLTSKDIQASLDNSDMNWDPDERKEAENLRDKLKKQEADKAAAAQDVENMKADYKKRTGEDFDRLKPEVQAYEIKRWKRKKAKK